MNDKNIASIRVLALLAFVMCIAGSGCSATVAKSTSIDALKPGQGILGIVVLSDDRIRRFDFRGPGGKVFSRKDLGGGVHLLLFVLYSGRYCITRVFFAHEHLNFNQQDNGLCFPIVVGKIGYMGHYLLQPDSGTGDIIRLDRPGRFKKAIEKKYPGLSVKYPVIDLLRLNSAVNSHRNYKRRSSVYTRG